MKHNAHNLLMTTLAHVEDQQNSSTSPLKTKSAHAARRTMLFQATRLLLIQNTTSVVGGKSPNWNAACYVKKTEARE